MNQRADGASGRGAEASRAHGDDRFANAMDAVRAAARGDISRRELARILQSWEYEPQHRTVGLLDDWGERRPNSFDAVYHAFVSDLIDEDTYEAIARRLDEADGSR
ncbi:hypothetical protein [Microbacterium sp. bgisy207]|uniref:hypothetical protein n=1 Tax=Microbacterium sp. bgisy207 TaxID=3413800 RepID=UPI003EBD3529